MTEDMIQEYSGSEELTEEDHLEHMRLNYPERIQKRQSVADGLTAALTFCDEGAFTDA